MGQSEILKGQLEETDPPKSSVDESFYERIGIGLPGKQMNSPVNPEVQEEKNKGTKPEQETVGPIEDSISDEYLRLSKLEKDSKPGFDPKIREPVTIIGPEPLSKKFSSVKRVTYGPNPLSEELSAGELVIPNPSSRSKDLDEFA